MNTEKSDSSTGTLVKKLIFTGFFTFIIMVMVVNGVNISNKNSVKEVEKIVKAEEIKEPAQTETTLETTTVAQTNVATVETTSRSGFDRGYDNIQEIEYISIEEVKISKDMDLSIRTGLTKPDFKILIQNVKEDKSGFFHENADLIYDLCAKYEINEIFFCGLIAGESGFNIASNHRRTYNYISLMVNGKLKQFQSVEDGLEQAAKALHNNYLTESGRFYGGKTLAGVQKRFCPNSSTWVNLIYSCMCKFV